MRELSKNSLDSGKKFWQNVIHEGAVVQWMNS